MRWHWKWARSVTSTGGGSANVPIDDSKHPLRDEHKTGPQDPANMKLRDAWLWARAVRSGIQTALGRSTDDVAVGVLRMADGHIEKAMAAIEAAAKNLKK